MATAISTPQTTESRLEWLCLAAVITMAGYGIPTFLYEELEFEWLMPLYRELGHNGIIHFYAFCVALLIVLPSPRRSGLRIGAIRPYAGRVLIVCGVPVLLTAVVYPQLPVRPYESVTWTFWVFVPLAEEMIFRGYLYGRFEPLFPGMVHPRVPIRWALVMSAVYFSAMHLPMLWISVGYGLFQLAYTFVGGVFVGLSRQWTGSILYGVLSHAGVNAIACYTS